MCVYFLFPHPRFRNKIGCFAENGFEPGVYVAMTESIHWGSTDFKAGKFLLPSGFQGKLILYPFFFLLCVRTFTFF